MVAILDKSLTFAEGQTRAKQSRNTIEYLLTFKSIIQNRTYYEKPETYLAFLDLAKAYNQKLFYII